MQPVFVVIYRERTEVVRAFCWCSRSYFIGMQQMSHMYSLYINVSVDKTFEGELEESNNQGIYLSKFTRAMTSCAMLRYLVIDTSSYQVLLVVRNCLHLQCAGRAPFNNFFLRNIYRKSFE
mmetsp:Transcript_9293/g.12011  ORF Transcript_9293/g.12011 Transcript_9293/m.12011 type:complete len:121 (-) Transcript_9293:41-403(-)